MSPTTSSSGSETVGLSAKNRFYRANRDLGRIFKTEFILRYLSEPELRRRIRRGLLKVRPRNWFRGDRCTRSPGYTFECASGELWHSRFDATRNV
jgi:hypothetical protein